MHDGAIIFNTKIDNSDVEKDLKNLERKIRKAEETISENENKKLPLTLQAEELGAKLKEAQSEAAKLKAEMSGIDQAMAGGDTVAYTEASLRKPQVEENLKKQNAEVAQLQKQWDSIVGKIDRYDMEIQQAEDTIARSKERATQLAAQVNSGGVAMRTAFTKAKTAAEKFEKRIISLGKRVFVFTVIAQAFRAIKDYMGKVLKTNAEYTTQVAKLKAALVTAFQPLYEYVLPGLIAAMETLTVIVSVLANLMSAMFGSTLSQSAESAKKLNEEADALDNVGEAANRAKRNLAGFDEVNRMSSEGTGSSESTPKYNFDDFNTVEYKAKIDELTGYLILGMAAVGAILAFSGANIPLGIALMAGGTAAWVTLKKTNWGYMNSKVEEVVTQGMTILGGAMLLIGAILAFSGTHVVKGIALMALGATSIGYAQNVNWSTMKDLLQGASGLVMGILSGTLLAVGAILAFSGAALPLGLGLMAAGAAGLVASIAANWNTLQPMLKESFDRFIPIFRASLLVVGALLAFTGANLPLGIGLIAAGAVSLGEYVAVNWNTIERALRGPIGAVVGLASASLLAFGVILLFTGAGIPLGLGLIAAGAAGLAAAIAPNWNFLKDKVSGVWKGIVSWFKTNVAPVFTKQYWLNKWSNITSGLKDSFKNGINAAISLFNSFIRWINQKMTFTWKPFYIGGIKIFDGGGFKLMNIPEIPMLAKGAVIPPNAPFMAMLGDQRHGTNIEAPLETIQEAVAIVMEDVIRSNMVGHEATVAVLRDILQAVLGIHIGDDVIGQAVERYNSDMALIRGGNR